MVSILGAHAIFAENWKRIIQLQLWSTAEEHSLLRMATVMRSLIDQ